MPKKNREIRTAADDGNESAIGLYPSPFELARLAAVISPKEAGGTEKEQRALVRIALRLWCAAVETLKDGGHPKPSRLPAYGRPLEDLIGIRSERLPFDDAVKLITGESQSGRAKDWFFRFKDSEAERGKRRSARRVEEEGGYTSQEIVEHREAFLEWKRRVKAECARRSRALRKKIVASA